MGAVMVLVRALVVAAAVLLIFVGHLLSAMLR
jgi:hypothetical protein